MLRTERLLLRPWREDDLASYAAINRDPAVRRFFPGVLDREDSDAEAHRIQANRVRDGFGLYAVEVPGVAPFIGVVGVMRRLEPGYPFTRPGWERAIEAAWRLDAAWWGRGVASEAARAAIAEGFARDDVDEIVAQIAVGNSGSRGVAAKLGMTHDPTLDFDHPKVPEGHQHRRHVLYRLPRARWQAGG